FTGGINTTSTFAGAGVQSIVFNGAGWNGNIAVATNPIIGNGLVVKGAGGGTLLLATSNSYSGGTQLKGGVLVISDDSNLGAPGTTLTYQPNNSSGTLLTLAPVIGTRTVNMNTGVGTIDTQGFNSVFGNLTGTGTMNVVGGGNVSFISVKPAGLLVGSSSAAGGAGTVTVTGARSSTNVGQLTSLTIAGAPDAWTAGLDTGQNDLIVTAGNVTTIANQIKSGFHSGDWNGTGIRSNAAASAASSGH